jgi:hypothetical protein
VEIRRITVEGQPRQKVSETLSQPISWIMVWVPVTPAMRETAGKKVMV